MPFVKRRKIEWYAGCEPFVNLVFAQICHKQGLLNSGMSHTTDLMLKKLIVQNGTFWRL